MEYNNKYIPNSLYNTNGRGTFGNLQIWKMIFSVKKDFRMLLCGVRVHTAKDSHVHTTYIRISSAHLTMVLYTVHIGLPA